ncbi:hypothetical protein WN944_007259 [Citrus x changshan-huyou]|uniref:Uncharacterized protein n=1 Tax=Citrus x changshan-huyou TaxID=2935761 RepID=A0AAP0MQV0_9ROSI
MFLPFLSFAKPQKRTFASFSFNPIILWSLPLLLSSRPSSLPLLLPSKPNGPYAEPNSKPFDQSTIRHRGPSTGASASASSSSSPAYTEEQIAIVRQIKKRKIIACVDGSDGFNLRALIQLLLDYPVGSVQRVRLEKQVEKDYFTILAQNCRLEIQRQQWGFIKETPHCDMWQTFQYSPAW